MRVLIGGGGGDLSAHFLEVIKFCSSQPCKGRPVNTSPCCRQSSWPVSILHLHIQNLPSDRKQKLVLSPREA